MDYISEAKRLVAHYSLVPNAEAKDVTVLLTHLIQVLEPILSKEKFCFCNNDISLQMVSGGAATEGLHGRVTLKVKGVYVNYVKVQHQSTDKVDAIIANHFRN
jgi:hypothetical protein